MSEVTWAKAQQVGNSLAKDVLKTLASWADADGYCWSPIAVMAFEMEKSERTVQRGLAWLLAIEDGPLELTERQHLRDGRLYPVYRLRLERGPANTREALKALREAGGCGAAPGLGVTAVSPQGEAQDQATGDRAVTPRGDNDDSLGVTAVTPHHLKESSKLEIKPEAGAREAAFAGLLDAWSAVAPHRVSRPRDRAAFEAVCEAGFDPDAVLAAARRCLAEDPDVKAKRVLALERWLVEQRFEFWTPKAGGTADPLLALGWRGPPEIRAAVVAARTEGFARSYLDPAVWAPAPDDAPAQPRGAIRPRTSAAQRALADLARVKGWPARVTIGELQTSGER